MKHLVGALWFYLLLCNVLTPVLDRQRLGELDSVSVTLKWLVSHVQGEVCLLGYRLAANHFGVIHSLVFSIEGRAWQEPEPSHVTGMALAHYILGKFLLVVCQCFPRL